MTWLETIGYGIAIWCGLVALVIALASYQAYRRDPRLHASPSGI